MIKRKGDWFYYYDSDKNVMGRLNIYSEEFVGATSCMIKLYDHIMMIKVKVRTLYDWYLKYENYTMPICIVMDRLSFANSIKSFIRSKFPKEYYNSLGLTVLEKLNAYRFPNGEERKKFLVKLNSKYGSTTTINETV